MWSRLDRRTLARLALLWWAGANLRIALLAAPPVMPLIHRDLHLDATHVGALTGLPVLLFAVAAVTGSLLVARLGARRALIVGLLVVAAGSAMRGVGPAILILFAGTFATAAGVAMMQPAMPAVARAWCPASIGLATAVYANGLLVGEVMGAGLTIPWILPLVGESWPWAFAVWSVPAILTALAVRYLVPDGEGETQRRTVAWWPNWRSGQTWRIGLILGGASCLYFTTNGFIPDLLAERGESERVGAALFWLNTSQIPASILMTVFPAQLMSRRRPLVLVGIVGVGAVFGLLFSGGWWLVWWAGAIGFSGAFILIWTLALPPMIAPADEVPRMSAAIFTIGYACSFVSPLIGGALWDFSGISALALAPPLVALGAMLAAVAGLRFPARDAATVGRA